MMSISTHHIMAIMMSIIIIINRAVMVNMQRMNNNIQLMAAAAKSMDHTKNTTQLHFKSTKHSPAMDTVMRHMKWSLVTDMVMIMESMKYCPAMDTVMRFTNQNQAKDMVAVAAYTAEDMAKKAKDIKILTDCTLSIW